MKQIKIKTLRLTNFKGVRTLEAQFKEGVTTVSGANGTGKTTLFDAFTWLLFGKDSQDRKTFDIKTLDTDGKAIAKLPHEVEAELEVDGKAVTLTRRYSEKWTKKRGEAEEQMTGHEETRLWNDVPMSVKDWAEKVESLCTEQVFKYITNPSYFTSQKPDVQRSMLFYMAGDVDDAEVAKGNEDFEALVLQLSDKSMEELKKEVSAKKKRVKAEVETMPARIDELERAIADRGDVNEARAKKGIEDTEAKIAKIDAEQTSATEAFKAKLARYQEKADKAKQITAKMAERERQLTDEALREWRTATEENASIEAQAASLQADYDAQKHANEARTQQMQVLSAELDNLRSEWQAINAETLTFDENAFICPTCKRPLDVEDIETKQAEMRAAFNASKAERLAANNAKGKETKQRMETLQTEYQDATYLMDKLASDMVKLRATKKEAVPMPNTADIILKDAEYKALQKEYAKAQEAEPTDDDTTEGEARKAERKELTALCDSYKRELNAVGEIAKMRERIGDLTEQMKEGAQALAELERQEYTMAQFVKARIATVEGRINAMFPTVRFKLYEEQINGGEKETCEATVNGVPYSSLNHAGQILAGLEIINAICHKEEVTAPVFIDNAEAVNAFPSMESQMILLRVTEDKSLTIA